MSAVLLGLQAAVFALWSVLVFRLLFRLRARAVLRSGRSFPGLGATLESYGAFLKAPDYARDRRLVGWVTLVMVAVIALASLT